MEKTNKELEAEVMQIIKDAPKERRRHNKFMKAIDDSVEKNNLEFAIGCYKLSELWGGCPDACEREEQRRRLWMLSILRHKEDDEFLKRLGLIHISKLKEKK